MILSEEYWRRCLHLGLEGSEQRMKGAKDEGGTTSAAACCRQKASFCCCSIYFAKQPHLKEAGGRSRFVVW